MAQKPEARFVSSIHRLLPKDLHHEGMSNPYRGGTADDWYDGPAGDLWVEYKYSETIPKLLDLRTQTTSPKLSKLQQRWLEARHVNGRNVAVIVGFKEGGVIMRNSEWLEEWTREDLQARLKTRKEIAQWIMEQVLCL